MDSKRAQYIKRTYHFEKLADGNYRASVDGCSWSSKRVIEGPNREEVIREFRAHWAHFNFEDEAVALREVFEAVL